MEMKPIQMMTTFFPNRTVGIFSASTQSVNIIVLVFDFETSADIKKEQQDQLMFLKGVIVIQLLAELEAMFLQTILIKVGHDGRLIIMIFKVMNTFSVRFKSNFETPKIDIFLIEISKSENGHTSVKIEMHDTREVRLLSYNHRGGRYQAPRIDVICKNSISTEKSLLLVADLLEQSQKDSLLE